MAESIKAHSTRTYGTMPTPVVLRRTVWAFSRVSEIAERWDPTLGTDTGR